MKKHKKEKKIRKKKTNEKTQKRREERRKQTIDRLSIQTKCVLAFPEKELAST